MPTTVRRRGRALASLTAALGLGVATLATTGIGSAAQAADPGEGPATGCPTAFPVSELVRGAQVTGLTVEQGTAPTGFTGEVIGVLDDGVGVGVDMVMAELDSAELERVGGIWQGMSGSPVYAADGRLIGAVAYGLSAGASPVAGITPYEQMDDYLTGEAPATEDDGAVGQVPVDKVAARAIARRTEVSAAQARQGFTQLPMPLGISGVGERRLAGATEAAAERKRAQRWFPTDTYAIGRTSAAAAGAGDVVAGGNVAASLSHGDITQAGVGTVTSVCGEEITAFGHPMGFFGDTTMSLHPADVLYVQRESLGAPFKVANLGAPVGTITDDRTTGLTGFLGSLPETATISTTTGFEGRSRDGLTHASVRTPDVLANTAFMQVMADHDRVIDGYTTGSELMTWTITGTDDGRPFALSFTDRYTSTWDLAMDMGFALGDMVYAISRIPGVTIDSVRTDAEAEADDATYRVRGVEQLRDGEWVALGRKVKAEVRAGGTLELRAVVKGPDGTTTLPFSFDVPRYARGSKGSVELRGGNWLWGMGGFTSIPKAQRKLARMVRNDEVQARLDIHVEGGKGGKDGGNTQVPDGGRSAGQDDRIKENQVMGPLDRTVDGYERVRVIIR